MLNESNGQTSTMRVALVVNLIIGALLCVVGAYGFATKIVDSASIVAIGAGLMSTGGFAKAVQKKWEK